MMTAREHMKELQTQVDNLKHINRSLQQENAYLHRTAQNIRAGANSWKRRAKMAEKRHKELVLEKVQLQDAHERKMEDVKALLIDAEDRECRTSADLHNARAELEDLRWEKNTQINELRYEIVCLKAHAYDLAFGSATEREGMPNEE